MARGDESSRAAATRVRQARGRSGVDPALEQAVARYVDRILNQRAGDYERIRESVGGLTGERGKDAAARLSLIRALVESVPAVPASSQISAAPTQADFNKLQADVSAVFSAVSAMRRLLR